MRLSVVTENTILLTTYNHLKIVGPGKMKVGDIEEISELKHVFDEVFTPNWTTELFKIAKVPISY